MTIQIDTCDLCLGQRDDFRCHACNPMTAQELAGAIYKDNQSHLHYVNDNIDCDCRICSALELIEGYLP